MPVVYLTIPGSAVKAESNSLVVTKDKETLLSLEAVHVSGVILIGRVAVTSPAMVLMLHEGIPAAFLSRSGKIEGRLVPCVHGAVDARLAQYQVTSNPEIRLELAIAIVLRKFNAMLAQIRRCTDNHPGRHDPQLSAKLKHASRQAKVASSLHSLLGIEGTASAAYWSAFARMNRSELQFSGRTKRPPRDPVNAMLSFAYALLTNEIWSLLDAIGLDPYLGFYHQPHPHRPALALDLMEPFRHAVVDRAVLKAINLNMFSPDDFTQTPDNAFQMNRGAIKQLIKVYENAMLQKADRSLLGDHMQEDLSAREALRKRCEQTLTWFRSQYKKPEMDTTSTIQPRNAA